MAFASAAAPRRKPYGGMQMEGPIARWYAHITRDRADHRATASAIVGMLAPASDVLEVAPGPGFTAIELARLAPGFRISGIDISRTFVRMAQDNARHAGVDIDFRHGDVAQLPYAAEAFDFVYCKAAFKNFPDPVRALDEIYRVLRRGGRASIFDLRKDAPRAAIEAEIRDMHLSALSAFLTRLTFRTALLRAAYTRAALERVVAQSRFGHGDILADGIGFELRLVK
jgi:ubiquinone/menaquinone biosynthesis C-methylase UbiE